MSCVKASYLLIFSYKDKLTESVGSYLLFKEIFCTRVGLYVDVRNTINTARNFSADLVMI